MTKLYFYLRNLSTLIETNEDGQDLIEYALLVALIAIIAIISIVFAGEAVSAAFSSVASSLNSVF